MAYVDPITFYSTDYILLASEQELTLPLDARAAHAAVIDTIKMAIQVAEALGLDWNDLLLDAHLSHHKDLEDDANALSSLPDAFQDGLEDED